MINLLIQYSFSVLMSSTTKLARAAIPNALDVLHSVITIAIIASISAMETDVFENVLKASTMIMECVVRVIQLAMGAQVQETISGSEVVTHAL